MRIKDIRVYSKLLPVRGGAYRMARTSVEHLDSTIVEIDAGPFRGSDFEDGFTMSTRMRLPPP